MNNYQKERFAKYVVKSLFNTIAEKRICILGFAFKKNTGDTRETASVYVAKHLLKEHAILILTEWDEFKTLDYEKIYKSMTKPAFVFDGRNILKLDKLKKIGFQVYGIGQPVQ